MARPTKPDCALASNGNSAANANIINMVRIGATAILPHDIGQALSSLPEIRGSHCNASELESRNDAIGETMLTDSTRSDNRRASFPSQPSRSQMRSLHCTRNKTA